MLAMVGSMCKQMNQPPASKQLQQFVEVMSVAKYLFNMSLCLKYKM